MGAQGHAYACSSIYHIARWSGGKKGRNLAGTGEEEGGEAGEVHLCTSRLNLITWLIGTWSSKSILLTSSPKYSESLVFNSLLFLL